MIFTVRQLTQKATEHRAKEFLVFVNLPCEGLKTALEKLGIPEEFIVIVRSFHENMKARVRVDRELLEEIEVENGLHQGCTTAPSLFNLYACVVAERWLDRVSDVKGVGTLVYIQSAILYVRAVHRSHAQFTNMVATVRNATIGIRQLYEQLLHARSKSVIFNVEL